MASKTGTYRHFPTRIFVAALAVVCLAMAVSTISGFRSMIQFRNLYLEERAHEISTILPERLRGPDRLDPGAWRRVIDEALQSGSYPWLKGVALVDPNGQVIATSGSQSDNLYWHEAPVRVPRRGRQGGRFGPPGLGPERDIDQPASLNLRIGVDRSSASFIAQQAYLHLGVSSLAIVALALLGFLFLRTFRRFLELQSEQESERHLAALGRLSATLAHEIRNPLAAIKGLTQVAQERLPRDHDTQELMTTVVTEAERLERLVTDLLAFARPRPMTLVELDLKQLVASIAERVRNQTAEKRIVLKLPAPDPPAPVRADSDALTQVFLNVLLNAIEASPRESTIEVRIDRSGDNYSIEIIDEGSGIGEQDPEELFQPFVTTKTRGTGLGLHVSRQIIERLGGTIDLRNRQPKGAVCRLTLPARVAFSPLASASRG